MTSRALTPLLLLTLTACGAYAPSMSDESPASSVVFDSSAGGPSTGYRGTDEGETGRDERSVTANAAEGRKLIRTGSLSVVVEDYSPFRDTLLAQIDTLGGFVADTDLTHYAGKVGSAMLVLRVPAERFDELVSWAESSVEVQRLNVDTADVTDQWVDVAARIENNRRAERRLVELLSDATGDLEDILAVERELSRVRGEIEAAEGRMRMLEDRVGLATLTLQVTVRAPYEPALQVAYFDRIGGAFLGSIEAMRDVAAGLGIVMVALLPWLLVLSAMGVLLLRIARTLWRRRSV